jgi:LPXTG-motif cell wall-anchored protein
VLAGAAATVAIAAAVFGAAGSAAADGTAYVLSDVECDAAHNGVLDLTLVNERDAQEAVFVVARTERVPGGSVAVAAASASALTFTDLVDGPLVVPVSVDGVTSDVSVRVACDAPEVAVMGAPVVPAAGIAAVSPAAPLELPSTGASSTGGLVIGSALVVAGMAASLVSRRRCP